jgi:hypothetical protein
LGSQASNLQHVGSQNRFFGQLGSLASNIVSSLAANADILIHLSGKPSQQSSTSWQPWKILWSAGQPIQLYSQHLGSQFRYLDSVVWEAKLAIFNILAAKRDFLVLVSWAA